MKQNIVYIVYISICHSFICLPADISSQVKIHPEPTPPPVRRRPAFRLVHDLPIELLHGLLFKRNGHYFPAEHPFVAIVSSDDRIVGIVENGYAQPIYNHFEQSVEINIHTRNVDVLHPDEIMQIRFHQPFHP